MKYHLVHLGCQMNQSDAERIKSVLHAMGYSPTDQEEEAQLLGVVACSVRQKAIDKVYSKIAKWNTWKNSKNLLTFVSGCILPADREKFLQRFDLLFSINELPELPKLISQYGVTTPGALKPEVMDRASQVALHNSDKTPKPALAPTVSTRPVGPLWLKDPKPQGLAFTPLAVPAGVRKPEQVQNLRKSTLESIRALQEEIKDHGGEEGIRQKILSKPAETDPMGGFWHIPPSYSSTFEAYIPIQNGCDKFCTFCAVPYTRGREVSRPSAEILAEVRSLIDKGFKIITLLGQNVNSYGLDKPGQELSFPQLMEEIGKIGEEVRDQGKQFWVYFTSPHPRDMTEDLLHIIARYPVLAKQIHLPIQSGDEKVLFKMNRNHSIQRYREIVHNIWRILPTATLFTDIIVGFTGETEEQFLNTKRAMEEFKYHMAFVAMYSPRPGAASSRWDDLVPLEEKKRRLAELSEVLHETCHAHNKNYLGQTLETIVESYDEKTGWLSGKTEGKINIRTKPLDHPHPQELVGEFVQIKVTSCRPMSLEGELTALGLISEQNTATTKQIHPTHPVLLGAAHS